MKTNREDSDINSAYRDILAEYADEGRLRSIPPERRDLIRFDLSSNDYLGLSVKNFDSDFVNNLSQQMLESGFSSSASRLLAQRQKEHEMLENELKSLYGRPALLFNSGYHANVGIIPALAIPGTIILADKLIHASAIDGMRLSGAEWKRWQHNDLEKLEKLIEKYESQVERLIVVAESIYSMDGDMADLVKLVELKKKHPKVMLYVDEAHAVGVRGHRGLGLAEELGVMDEIDVLVGTFGKALASTGAFAITNATIKDFLLNNARSFIFSTALPPANSLWTLNMLKNMVNMSSEREHLLKISKDFSNFIGDLTGQHVDNGSQIVPLLIGDAQLTVKMADKMKNQGIDAMAIRRPTVPAGGERIRFSLNANITDDDLSDIKAIIKECYLSSR